MPLFKTTITADAEIDVWIEADDADHAEGLACANNSETYDRIKSTVSFGTGSIRIDNASIEIVSIEAVV